MSQYYDEDRRRARPARDRRYDSYDDDTHYESRGPPQPPKSALVKRRDSYDSVVDEEVVRDFPPDGRGGYVRETTIRKSGHRPARPRSLDDEPPFYDDRYDDRSYATSRRGGREYDDRRDRRSRRRQSSEYDSRSRSRSRTRSPPPRERRKSQSEKAIEALGLGGVIGGLLGKKEHDDHKRDRERDQSRDRSLSRDRGYGGRSQSRGRRGSDEHDNRALERSRTGQQWAQAAKAAVLAGAAEAFRARKEPGGWSGDKGKRVLTAAISAGGIDGFISHHKDPNEHSTRNIIGSAIAGLATNRVVNGPRSQSRGQADKRDHSDSRSRSRSRSPPGRRARSDSRGGGLGDLAAGGALGATAKNMYDKIRGQSRGRERSRSRSGSEFSRSPSRSRKRSLSRGVAKGLAAVGLGSAADKVDPDRRRGRRYSDDSDDGYRRNEKDYYRDDVGQPQSAINNGQVRDVSQSRGDWHGASRAASRTPSDYSLDYGPHHNGDPDTDSDSDLGSSTDEEREKKKSTKKMWLTGGLATIATIHAGHTVYQSYEKREARKRAVEQGKIGKEQAEKNKNRDRLQDVASVGLAALGIKGAYSEWKEMKESRDERKETIEKMHRHRAKRAARREKFRQIGGGDYDSYSSSMPDLHAPIPLSGATLSGDSAPPPYLDPSGQSYTGYGPQVDGFVNPSDLNGAAPNGGPTYHDGNPYASVPQFAPPPMGSHIWNGTVPPQQPSMPATVHPGFDPSLPRSFTTPDPQLTPLAAPPATEPFPPMPSEGYPPQYSTQGQKPVPMHLPAQPPARSQSQPPG